MRYYFTAPERMLESLKSRQAKDYILLYNWLMAPVNEKIDYVLSADMKDIRNEFNFFILESCRFFVDKQDYDENEKYMYFKLVEDAYENLLIHKEKVETYFRNYIEALFSKDKKLDRGPPKDLSGVVIDLMLAELEISAILNHVNLNTQEVDIQSIGNTLQLEKINFVKSMHDKVLFFIEYYNNWVQR